MHARTRTHARARTHARTHARIHTYIHTTYIHTHSACGLQTAPIEDIWVPFMGNGTRATDQWTPAGPLTTDHSRPLGLPLTQPWRPFGVVPTGRRVQGGFSMAWAGGQVTFASIRGAGHLAPLYRPAASYTLMAAFQKGEPLPPPFYPHTAA